MAKFQSSGLKRVRFCTTNERGRLHVRSCNHPVESWPALRRYAFGRSESSQIPDVHFGVGDDVSVIYLHDEAEVVSDVLRG